MACQPSQASTKRTLLIVLANNALESSFTNMLANKAFCLYANVGK